MKRFAIVAAGMAAFLTGCGSQPVVGDQALALQPDQGIAAVMLDAPDRISQVQFGARFKGGGSFEVPDTQGGPALYLVPVQAGRYCLEHFRYDRRYIKSKQNEDVACFIVLAGKISYSGTIVPETTRFTADQESTLWIGHHYRPLDFQPLLQSQYPQLAAAYPVAEPPPAPAGVEVAPVYNELSTWIRKDGATHSHLIYFRNNASWPVLLQHVTLLDCQNLAQACSEQSVNVTLAPFEIKQVIALSPADKGQPFSYQYHYEFTTAK